VKVRLSAAIAAGLYLLLALPGVAENPFLNAKADAPAVAKFKGVEWNDEFEEEEYPWSSRVTTRRLATAKWGAFFQLTFDQITTKGPRPREMRPLYFFTTDDMIVLFNEQNPEVEIVKLAAQEQPPTIEPTFIYGLSKGTRKVAEGDVSEAMLAVKGDRSTFVWTHGSGHFTRATWQRGFGLVEYAQGYGARKDGFVLKREAPAAKSKKR
jgi:hypothetical protein